MGVVLEYSVTTPARNPNFMFLVSLYAGLYNRTDVLPTNRSGFIAQNNNEVLSNAPSDSIPVIVITAIALTAGVFAIVFFSVIFVLVSHRICKQERQQYLRLARIQDTELSLQSQDSG